MNDAEKGIGTDAVDKIKQLLLKLDCIPKMELVDACLDKLGIKAGNLMGGMVRLFGVSGDDLDKMARDAGWPEGDYRIVVTCTVKGVKPMGRAGRIMAPRTFTVLLSAKLLKDPDAPMGKREVVALDNGFTVGDGDVGVPADLYAEGLKVANMLNGYIQEGSINLADTGRIIYKRAIVLDGGEAANTRYLVHAIDCGEKYLIRAIPSFMKIGIDIKQLEKEYHDQEAKYQQEVMEDPMISALCKSVQDGDSDDKFKETLLGQLAGYLDKRAGQDNDNQDEEEDEE